MLGIEQILGAIGVQELLWSASIVNRHGGNIFLASWLTILSSRLLNLRVYVCKNETVKISLCAKS